MKYRLLSFVSGNLEIQHCTASPVAKNGYRTQMPAKWYAQCWTLYYPFAKISDKLCTNNFN